VSYGWPVRFEERIIPLQDGCPARGNACAGAARAQRGRQLWGGGCGDSEGVTAMPQDKRSDSGGSSHHVGLSWSLGNSLTRPVTSGYPDNIATVFQMCELGRSAMKMLS